MVSMETMNDSTDVLSAQKENGRLCRRNDIRIPYLPNSISGSTKFDPKAFPIMTLRKIELLRAQKNAQSVNFSS